jgi:hypothetical protein
MLRRSWAVIVVLWLCHAAVLVWILSCGSSRVPDAGKDTKGPAAEDPPTTAGSQTAAHRRAGRRRAGRR